MLRPRTQARWPGSWYEHSSVYSQEDEDGTGWSPLEGRRPPRPISQVIESDQHLQRPNPSDYSLAHYPSTDNVTALPELPITEPLSKEANNYITGWRLALLLFG